LILGIALSALAAVDPDAAVAADRRKQPMQFELLREGPAEACGSSCGVWVSAIGVITVDTPDAFERFAKLPGIDATIVPDPTDNPLERLKLAVDPERARITAWSLADALAAGDPPVIVRDHEVEHGFFYLDPCNLHPGEAEIVADRIAAELARARERNATSGETPAARRARRYARLLRWPD